MKLRKQEARYATCKFYATSADYLQMSLLSCLILHTENVVPRCIIHALMSSITESYTQTIQLPFTTWSDSFAMLYNLGVELYISNP